MRHFIYLFIFLFICVDRTPSFAQFKKGGFYSEARNGNISAVKKLLNDKKNLEPAHLNDALQAAVTGNHFEMVKFLVKKGANPNLISVGPSPLLINAIMYDYFDSARALILTGADVNVRGYKRVIYEFQINWDWTALMCAAYKGRLELVKLLVDKKADLHAQGWSQVPDELETAADIAAYSGRVDVLEYLLKKGVAINPNTIFKAARGGHTKVVELLLKKGDQINRPGSLQGRTLLIEASWWGHKDLIEYLLKNGAEINKQDTQGYTALSEVVASTREDFSNQLEIAKLLVDNGANVNLSDFFGITPLMRATKADVIQFLTEHGAKNNQP
ncbi:MAG: ankyrin repeat domain-containing protein [Candidatus Omnitrophica bacterium]|nr:ankyrin repeat domain-containing protein [Candidatus Omnitrophota bacterium]